MSELKVPYSDRALYRAERDDENKRAALIAAATFYSGTEFGSSQDVLDLATKFTAWLEKT